MIYVILAQNKWCIDNNYIINKNKNYFDVNKQFKTYLK